MSIDKKFSGSCVTTLANKSVFNNEQLAEEFHKPIIKKIQKEPFILHSKKVIGVLI